jgi:RNA polymerase sigma-70 factor (ECF subfamily)
MAPKLRLLRLDPPAAPDEVPADAELVRRLAQGDDRAAVLLWRAHSVMVRGLATRMLGPTGEIEDLVQDVFSIFFRKVRSLKNPAALRAFLFGITIREVRSHLRRRRVRKWLELTSSGQVADVGTPGDANAHHAFIALHRVLESVETRARLAFVLRHVEGYELGEVAEALSCSLATVKRVLSAAETAVHALGAHDPHLGPYIAQGEVKSDDGN